MVVKTQLGGSDAMEDSSYKRYTRKYSGGSSSGYESRSSTMDPSSSYSRKPSRESSYSAQRYQTSSSSRSFRTGSVDRDASNGLDYRQSEKYFKTQYPDIFNGKADDGSSKRPRRSYSVDRDYLKGTTLDKDGASSRVSRRLEKFAAELEASRPRPSSRDRSHTREYGRSSSDYSPSSSLRTQRRASVDYTSSSLNVPGSSRSYRASSVSRLTDLNYDISTSRPRYSTSPARSAYSTRDYSYESSSSRAAPRAASISRFVTDQEPEFLPSRQRRATSISRYSDYSDLSSSSRNYSDYTTSRVQPSPRLVETKHGYAIEKVEAPVRHVSGTDRGTSIEDDDVQVFTLPSGKRAVTYTQFSQKGHGERNLQNQEIERVIHKTTNLQKSMTTLEEFVKRNRHLFPEETTIYQQLRFFQLNEEQLFQIGQSPDAEVYGVKVKERLVVPEGTDVAYILNRYYGKTSEVEIEYRGQGQGQGQSVPHHSYEPEKDKYVEIKESFRKQVEAEHEQRDREATRQQYNKCQISVNAGQDYDSIYDTPRSRRTSISGQTDRESFHSAASSASSRRRKSFDSGPHFTAKLRSKRCMEGQMVKFNCTVSGLPPPDVTWFKGNRIISQGNRCRLTNAYGLCCLEISDVKQGDAGLYSVKAANIEGEVACSAQLDVHSVDFGDDRPEATRRPYFILEAQNTYAEVGQKASLEAQAAGRPMPVFKWQKDNHALQESDRISVLCDEYGNSKLVIRNVQPSDAGLYFCMAESKLGKIKCAATLRVVDRGQLAHERERRRSVSREPTPVRYGRSMSRETTPVVVPLPDRGAITRGTKPWFIQVIPSEKTVHEGEPLTLRCIVDGDPKPVVTWLKGGGRELEYSKRHRVVVDKDHHMMQIRSTMQTDPGEYTAVAWNCTGKVMCKCWVNILPRREEEEEEEIKIKRTRLEFPQYETEVTRHTELGNIPPRFVKRLPMEPEVTAGETLQIKCKVKELQPDTIYKGVEVKLKVKGETEPVKDEKPAPEPANQTEEPMEVDAPAGPELAPEKAPEPAPEPEQKKESEEDTESAKEVSGTDCSTEHGCSAEETPVPVEKPQAEVSTKTEDTPPPAEATTTDEASESATDKSEKADDIADSADTGGATSSSQTPVVSSGEDRSRTSSECGGVPPEFLLMLEDVTIATADIAKLSIKMSGTPFPDIKWFKDGQEIDEDDNKHWNNKTYPLARYETFVEEDLFNLEIYDTEVADSGIYSCFISNDGGSSSCSCVIKVEDDERSKPKFLRSIRDRMVMEGATARFDCKVIGKPDPEITWTKDSKKVTKSSNLKLKFEDGLYILTISNVQRSDEGVYTVTATSAAGTKADSATLKVETPALSSDMSATSEERETETDTATDKTLSDSEMSEESTEEADTGDSEEDED